MSDEEALRAEIAEWQALVGTAIVSFGELELITLKCLAHIPHDRISDTASRLGFGQRVDLLLEILNGRKPLPEVVLVFAEKLKRAKKLAETRNLIAHNPVMLNLYVHMSTGDFKALRSITSARGDGRSIELEDLKEYAAEVEDLASELWLQIGKITLAFEETQ